MSKPNFSIVSIFWLMLAACGFLAGRVSTQRQLERAESDAINSQIDLERNEVNIENVVHTNNEFSNFITVLDALGDLRVLTGRVLEVTESNEIRFEEYDQNGNTVSQFNVTIAGIRIPFSHQPYSSEANKRLNELLTIDEPYVILLVPRKQVGTDPVKAFVACQGAFRNYKTTFVQHDLISDGLAKVDRDNPIVSRSHLMLMQESEASQAKLGLWSLPAETH